MHAFGALRILRRGGAVKIGGQLYEMDTIVIDGEVYESDIKVGDTYIAGRNTGAKLLTAKEIVGDYANGGMIWNVEGTYPYNLNESVKVIHFSVEPRTITGPSDDELRAKTINKRTDIRVNCRLKFTIHPWERPIIIDEPQAVDDDGEWLITGQLDEYEMGWPKDVLANGVVEVGYNPVTAIGSLIYSD